LWHYLDCPLLTFYFLPPSTSNVSVFLVLETGFFLNNLDRFKERGLLIEETVEVAIVSL